MELKDSGGVHQVLPRVTSFSQSPAGRVGAVPVHVCIEGEFLSSLILAEHTPAAAEWTSFKGPAELTLCGDTICLKKTESLKLTEYFLCPQDH